MKTEFFLLKYIKNHKYNSEFIKDFLKSDIIQWILVCFDG